MADLTVSPVTASELNLSTPTLQYSGGDATDWGGIANNLISTAGATAQTFFKSPASLSTQAQVAAVTPQLTPAAATAPLVMFGGIVIVGLVGLAILRGKAK